MAALLGVALLKGQDGLPHAPLPVSSMPAAPPALDGIPARPAKWVTRYLYDDSRGRLTITDFKFPSIERGIAAGYVTRNIVEPLEGHRDKDFPMVLVTSDSGKTWTRVDVKEIPNSIFFLDDTIGWLVSDRSIWFTAEAGRTWRRISEQKGLLRVYFLSRSHGFAVGSNKRVLESFDGGVTWQPLPVAAQPKTTREWTTYSAIAFDESGQLGMIAGFSHPTQGPKIPELVDMQELPAPRQVPNESIFLGTKDAGKTWDLQTASLFGEVTHISLSSLGFGLGLIEFHDEFPWPSEVYKLSLANGKNDRVFREKDRAITDVLCVAGGDCFLAGIEPPGKAHGGPIPGKVKILRSADAEHWEELPVDYRAVARRVWLSSPGGAEVWAATDTGMILKLQTE